MQKRRTRKNTRKRSRSARKKIPTKKEEKTLTNSSPEWEISSSGNCNELNLPKKDDSIDLQIINDTIQIESRTNIDCSLKRKHFDDSTPQKCLEKSEDEGLEEWPDDLINVEADGNCFYRAIALGLLGSEDVWKDIKKRVIEFIEDHENILFLEFDPDYIREAISYHKVENNWADELIYLMTAHCFNIKLEIENNRYGNSLIYNEECEEAKLFS